MKTAIYAGSFDPVTYGHLDVLKSGAEIFDKVIIAVSKNINKKNFLTVDERVELIKQAVSEIKNVEVASFDGLTVEFAKKNNAKFLLRGLRAVSDYEYEMQLSQTNQKLSPDIKTVFLITKPEYSFISSSTVREIYYNNGQISQFVPKCVEDYLKTKK